MGLLRFILAIAVVMAHVPTLVLPRFLPANMAVEIFFMISGFYMSLILSEKYDTRDRRGLMNFYASRFFRLWPVFIVTALLANLWWFASYAYVQRLPTQAAPLREWINNDFIYFLAKASNVAMIGQDVMNLVHVGPMGARFTLLGPGTQSDGAISMGYLRDIGPAWSIGVEIWFYLVAPFIVLQPMRWVLAFIAASLALHFGLSAAGYFTYFFFPAQLSLFLFGAIAYRLSRSGHLARPELTWVAGGLMLAGAVAFGEAFFQGDHAYRWLLYLALASTLGSLFQATKHSMIDRQVGELSYAIYVTHMVLVPPIGAVCKRLGLPLAGEFVLLAVVPFAWMLYLLVERPVTRWRARFTRRHPPEPAIEAQLAPKVS